MTIDESPFLRHFSVMPDPRVARGQKHVLTDLIAIAIIAALCGIDSFQGMDVSYNDDGSTVRKGHGAENLSTIRRIALNMLKREPRKASIPGKQILCSHNEAYLFKVLIS